MIERLTEEWRACQQRVHELERQVAAAMLAYFRGEGPPPADELKTQLSALRKKANELLTRALREIEDERKGDKP